MTTALIAHSLPLRARIKADPPPHPLLISTETSTRSSMALQIKTIFLFLLLLLIPLSSGMVEGFEDGKNPNYLIHKDDIQMNSRKLLVFDALLDYDDAGPNPKHDPSPKKGKPGVGAGGAKNP